MHESKKLLLTKRRAISNIIGSLIVLAIVASIGSVILFQGLNQINAFNADLQLHEKESVDEIREKIILEHVRFDPTASLPDGDNLHLYLANVGSIDSEIVSVTVVKIDTQELIFNRAIPDASQSYIPVEDHTEIILEDGANLVAGGDDVWNSTNYWGGYPWGTDSPPSYRITVETGRGNYFPWEVTPFND